MKLNSLKIISGKNTTISKKQLILLDLDPISYLFTSHKSYNIMEMINIIELDPRS